MPACAAGTPFRLGDDPLTHALEPPPNETAEEKNAREAKEVEAKRVSDLIDESIKTDRAAMKKEKEIVRVLLLGQSESGEYDWASCSSIYVDIPFPLGKSTTLKSRKSLRTVTFCSLLSHFLDFRLKYARATWKSERNSWRCIIQLNLIKSVNTILDAVHTEMSGEPANPLHPHECQSQDADDETTLIASSSSSLLAFSESHDLLKTRLSPLRQVETDLKKRLGVATDEPVDAHGTPMYATPFEMLSRTASPTFKMTGDLVVRSWKHVLERNAELSTASLGAQGSEMDNATRVIVNCKDDNEALWEDNVVQAVLKRGKVKLQDSAAL